MGFGRSEVVIIYPDPMIEGKKHEKIMIWIFDDGEGAIRGIETTVMGLLVAGMEDRRGKQ